MGVMGVLGLQVAMMQVAFPPRTWAGTAQSSMYYLKLWTLQPGAELANHSDLYPYKSPSGAATKAIVSQLTRGKKSSY
jgi:hypothetical protein